MHIPDGFIDGQTSLAGGAVAVAGLGVCLKKASDTMEDKQIPLAGLTAAFVFAVQMLNFPVAERHERPPPRRRPGGGARRPVGRHAVRLGRPHGAVPSLRRRWRERPRAQHRQHGDGRCLRWVRGLPPRSRSSSRRSKGSVTIACGPRGGPRSPARCPRVHPRVRDRRERRRLGRHGRRGHARRARPHRHR